MPFAIAAAGIGAAATIGGSMMQSSAAGKAADQSQKALDQQRADLAPWRTTGGQANTASADLLGLNGQDAATAAFGNFHTSPGYQWSFDQGMRGVDAGAAAKGMLRSGATLKAEQTFGTGLADQEFTSYYNRLFDMSHIGESAAAGGADTARQASNSALAAGNAQSSIYGNTASGLGGIANNLLSNKDFQSNFGGGGNFMTSSGYSNSAPAPINMNYTRSF